MRTPGTLSARAAVSPPKPPPRITTCASSRFSITFDKGPPVAKVSAIPKDSVFHRDFGIVGDVGAQASVPLPIGAIRTQL